MIRTYLLTDNRLQWIARQLLDQVGHILHSLLIEKSVRNQIKLRFNKNQQQRNRTVAICTHTHTPKIVVCFVFLQKPEDDEDVCFFKTHTVIKRFTKF